MRNVIIICLALMLTSIASASTNSCCGDMRDMLIDCVAQELRPLSGNREEHFLASFMAYYWFGSGDDYLTINMTAYMEALRVGIDKELTDKPVAKEVRDNIHSQIDLIHALMLHLGGSIKDLELDEGDLLADLVGIGSGMSLINFRNLQFEHSSPSNVILYDKGVSNLLERARSSPSNSRTNVP